MGVRVRGGVSFCRHLCEPCPTFCTCNLYDTSLTRNEFYSYNIVYIKITHVSLLVIYMLLLYSWQICSNPQKSSLC